MARSRVQSIRSNVSGARPASQEPGTIYTNWADRQIGVADSARQPMDLVAVRYFATTASYTPGQLVVHNGKVYRAIIVIAPSAFDPAKWAEISVQSGSGIWVADSPPPQAPLQGQLLWESDSGDLFVWYDDGSSAQWVQINIVGNDEVQTGWPTRPEFVAAVASGASSQMAGTICTAGGHQYVATAGATAIPDLPGFLPFGDMGLGHFGGKADGVTDDKVALTAAVNAMVSLKRKLWLPDARIAVSSGIVLVDTLINDAVVDIEGAGPNTELYALAGWTGGEIGVRVLNVEATGGLSVPWQYDPKPQPMDVVNPTSTMSNAGTGEWSITVPNGALFSNGDNLRIQTHQLSVYCEHRGYTYHGEINQVTTVAGNVLNLRLPLMQGYSNDAVWTGTATAGTTRTITIATGQPKDQVEGCRLTITAGTGSGQVRYIEYYDPATGVATLEYERNADFSPVPGATSVVTVDRKPYIFRAPTYKALRLRNIRVVASEPSSVAGKLQVGFELMGGRETILENIGTEGCTKFGINLGRTVKPIVRSPTVRNVNNTGLGYGVLIQGRDAKVFDIDGYNCRRVVDNGGVNWQVWNMECTGGQLVGGILDALGNPWNSDNPNGGIGEHGGARNWTYRNISIYETYNPCIQRAEDTVFDSIKTYGQVPVIYSLVRGRTGRIINHQHNGSLRDTPGVVYPGDEYNRGHFVFVAGNNFFGNITIQGGRLIDLTGSVVYIVGTAGVPAQDRFKGTVTIADGLDVEWCTPNSVGLISGTETFSLHGSEVILPRMSIRGGGTMSLYGNNTTTTRGRPYIVWKVNNTYRVSIDVDQVAFIPFWSSQMQMTMRAIHSNPTNGEIVDALLRRNSTGITNFGATATNIKMSATIPTGSTGLVGEVTLHYGDAGLYIENRMTYVLEWIVTMAWN